MVLRAWDLALGRLGPDACPVHLLVLWPRLITAPNLSFLIWKTGNQSTCSDYKVSLDNVFKVLTESISVDVFIEHLLSGRHVVGTGDYSAPDMRSLPLGTQ